jgi:hypothetical protein
MSAGWPWPSIASVGWCCGSPLHAIDPAKTITIKKTMGPKKQMLARLQGMLIGFPASLLLTRPISPLTHVDGKMRLAAKAISILVSFNRLAQSLLGSIRYPQVVPYLRMKKRSPIIFLRPVVCVIVVPVPRRPAFGSFGNRGCPLPEYHLTIRYEMKCTSCILRFDFFCQLIWKGGAMDIRAQCKPPQKRWGEQGHGA